MSKLIVSAMLLAMTAAPVLAESAPAGTVEGAVYAAFGEPLSGAVVTLSGGEDRSVSTGADGTFRFANVDASPHALSIVRAGYAQARRGGIKGEEGPFVVRLFAAAAGSIVPLTTIGRARSRGRIDNLIGSAASAAEGFVGHAELEERPILRPGELLETVPGVVISQHSGEGKANQYYLRGFNLDHGTDIAITIGGVPANMRTHAHGQGYSDINWLIPETINFVNYRKGTYNADQGDFSTAGAVDMTYLNVLPRSIASMSGGPYGQARILVAASPTIGTGAHLLYALEFAHEDNTADSPDNYRKYNAFVRYSRQQASSLWGVTAQAYAAKWMSSDQIPLRAVQGGIIGRFGQIDPTDGGRTDRYVLSGDYARDTANSSIKINAYALAYSLQLFSDFTYFLNDPVKTDQFEQTDQRLVTGINANRTWKTPAAENTLGYQLRNDNITPVGLFSSTGRRVTGAIRIDRVVETSNAVYLQTRQHLTPKLRLTAGLRGDTYTFKVDDVFPENSGTVRAGIVSPKLALSYALDPNIELYADYGQGFHSNDARGITQAGPAATPLVRATGAELGLRLAAAQKLRTTVSLWKLDLASELVFQGDAGTTSAGRPSHRYGIELANFYQPAPGITLDLDYASSAAKFTNVDPAGQTIPGSIKDVLTFGLAVDKSHVYGSVRLRYFGPRPLIEDGSVHSNPTTTVSVQAGFKPSKGLKVGIDAFNLFNAKASDIDYFYNSSIPSDPAYTKPGFAGACPIDQCGAGVGDVHFHPIERRLIRLTVTKQF